MNDKVLMFLGACVVGTSVTISVIGLSQVATGSRAEFPGLEVFGAFGMFGAMFAFVLAFIHIAIVAQRGQ